jgi:hypothetical protein
MILALALVIMCSSVSLASDWWDSPIFNYGVGTASIVAGYCMINQASTFDKTGFDNIREAQYWASLSGYDYAYGYTTLSNTEVVWSNESRSIAASNYAAASDHKAYGYALAANGLWLISRGICDSLKPVVSNKKIALQMSYSM